MIIDNISNVFDKKIKNISGIDKVEDVFNLIKDLRSLTEEYINLSTSFSKKNWLIDRINSYMVYGGKMIRSSFFYLLLFGILRSSGDLRDLDFWDRVFRLGAIFELVHSATLVHDDILDGAKKRRSKDSVHIKFGVDGALIFGDILIISTINQAFDINPLYSKFLMDSLENMCLGEVLQYQYRYNLDITEQDYFDILFLKTGVLFGAISKIAISMVYPNYDKLDDIYNIFSRYGVAFQIVDDYLDYYQDEKVLKKDSNNDLLSGRVTFPLIIYCGALSKDEKLKLRRIWVHNPTNFIKFIKSKVISNDYIGKYCLKKAEEFMNLDLFRNFASELKIDPVFQNALESFLLSLVYRSY